MNRSNVHPFKFDLAKIPKKVIAFPHPIHHLAHQQQPVCRLSPPERLHAPRQSIARCPRRWWTPSLFLIVVSHGCAPPGGLPTSSSAARRLTLTPESLDLGTLASRAVGRAELQVTNGSTQTIDIERVSTSCPCMTVAPGAFRVGPMQGKTIRVTFYPAAERDFRGQLRVDISGHGSDGEILLRTSVAVTVREATQPGHP